MNYLTMTISDVLASIGVPLLSPCLLECARAPERTNFAHKFVYVKKKVYLCSEIQ